MFEDSLYSSVEICETVPVNFIVLFQRHDENHVPSECSSKRLERILVNRPLTYNSIELLELRGFRFPHAIFATIVCSTDDLTLSVSGSLELQKTRLTLLPWYSLHDKRT